MLFSVLVVIIIIAFSFQYAENYCWAHDTYFLPLTTPAARSPETISYYQWMPFFLLFEAACFRLPCFIWKYFASQSGMRVGEILRLTTDDHNTVPEIRKENIHALCLHLQGALRFQKRLKMKNLSPHKVLRCLNIKYSTYYVTIIYVLAKVAFLVNVGLQTKLLNKYLLPHTNSSRFGFDVWRSFWTGNETWKENGLFPRVTLCDFEVREMGNIQTHTVQCVLLINVFTEKIFLLLWAWYVFLATLTACNLFSWMFAMFSETSKEHFIINHLEMCETPLNEEVLCFMDKYLGLDGIFLLRLMAQHADVVFITELIGALWASHYAIEEQRRWVAQPLCRHSPLQCFETNESLVTYRGLFQMSMTRRHSSLKRHLSVDEIESSVSKQFADSSSDEESPKEKKSGR
ncbi:unnamed protein product [Heligmosomoides polygyrus]|uniref:Innexin n=1 Tax=Heligmosomoides polygyrus TaxID=6339 RepID=A0A183G651_HELPZ|nr:unnamed protein product [Heligmosomoides polygyrus]